MNKEEMAYQAAVVSLTGNVSLKREWAVVPPFRSREATPEEATARATWCWLRNLARSMLIK